MIRWPGNEAEEQMLAMLAALCAPTVLQRSLFRMVGGIPTILKNMSSSVGMMKFPYIMEK